MFDRRWAVGLIEETFRRCQSHFEATDRAGHWGLFERRELTPALTGVKPPPLAECCAAAGFETPGQAASAVQEVRRRARILLREVVAETLDEGDDVDAELDNVWCILGGRMTALL